MPVDLPTFAALGTLAVAVVGLVIEYLRMRLRVRELEKDNRQFNEFMETLRKMAQTGELATRIQATQTTVAQRAVFGLQTAKERALTLAEQQARHERHLGYAKLALGIWDRLRSERDEDEDE